MSKMLGALFMGLLLAIYIVLVGFRAVQYIATGEPIAIAMGVALIALPAVGVWALIREFMFGFQAQRLSRTLREEGRADIGIVSMPSGRPVRAEMSSAFEMTKAEVETEPYSWQAHMRLALAYDASGDRRRARSALREAIELERTKRVTL